MAKSQAQTDAEILASAKIAEEILPEGTSEIRVRHTRSQHPIQCQCLIHRDITKRRNPSPIQEAKDKEELDWYQGD
jgi:hypothetical protein